MNGGSFDSIFDRIAVINLASRPDRRREATEELARIGLTEGAGGFEFFEAVRPEDRGDFPSIGAKGCFLSHLALLEESTAKGVCAVLILEDDMGFVRGIKRCLPNVCSALCSEPWDIFYGGYEVGEILDGEGLICVPPGVALGLTHCIGLRGDAIAEAAGYLRALLSRPAGDPLGGPMHVDGAYSWYRRAHAERRTLAASPPIAIQRPSRSDIFDDLAWYDRVPAFRPVISGLRRLQHKLT